MRVVATVYYWLLFAVTAVIGFVGVALTFLIALPFDPQRRGVHTFICLYTHQYLRAWPGWSVKVEHRERIPKRPVVYIANHQSMADIIAVLGLYRQFKFVSKASLFKLPLVGWSMSLAKYVSVERGKPKSMHEMMVTCAEWLKQGMSVLIFPEGTYSPDGRLLPFKAGAFVLALEQKVPVVPVLIVGTPDLVHEDGPWMSPRAHVHVTVQEPIQPETFGSDPEALAQRVRAQYAQWLGK